MCKNIAADILLSRLYEVDISKHALVLEGARQLACYCCGRMKTSEGNELEDETIAITSVNHSTVSYELGVDKPMLRKVPYEALERLF